MYHIVYLTTNLVNQKFYVGVRSTYNLEDGYIGSGKALKLAIKKYSKENFKRTILHYCLTKEDAYEIESQIVSNWLVNLDNCYNIAYGGDGGFTGKHTDSAKQKVSEANKGKSRRIYTPLSEETKQKIKDKRKLQIFSDETKLKMSISNNGRKHSDESKLKISKAKSGSKYKTKQI